MDHQVLPSLRVRIVRQVRPALTDPRVLLVRAPKRISLISAIYRAIGPRRGRVWTGIMTILQSAKATPATVSSVGCLFKGLGATGECLTDTGARCTINGFREATIARNVLMKVG